MNQSERDSAGATPPIVAIETIRTALQSNVVWVVLTSEDGHRGLGETFYGASAVEEYVHAQVAPVLLNEPMPSPQRVARVLSGYVGYAGSGVEVRGNSAIDIALWDLEARRASRPLRSLLGGPFRDAVQVYNTCAGNRYVSVESRQSSSNWGLPQAGEDRYEDLWRFLNEPGALAEDLRDEGYRGMKVWPFDLAAEASGGDHTADLRFGLSVLDEIRSAVGNEMELYVELHSLWQPAGAERLLRALERFDLTWAEDPLRADHHSALSSLRGKVGVPIAVGENLGAGFNGFGPLIASGGVDVAILDIGWSGGITAAIRTASLADQAGVPIAPHDCTGPVALAVAAHFVTSIPNGFVQEVARAFLHGWYGDVCIGTPVVSEGMIRPSDRMGHGVELTPGFLDSATTTRRVSAR
ncbi:L-alanine-DL-glutamate epimerase-like enolase superfamily enzyme [Microbacterium sp. SLBN-154]|uniref:mandelate racemase/muconate lactonizing enzyme family protein n=1 Tax=Microbacterium sp. SLBN-154 TaxID=2768458 RepID=UPI00114E92B6|nr:mandelate racemase/muconate lactonizing enzyme family protein [Microbacterium sp. SLBN-154]TQK17648.1 L-alanine-DL-glutamate epimerase-like enolase superfamily enzyme [Microbacterium sp. SLBN-154]